MLATESKLPLRGGPEKRAYVRQIFAAIAPTYDRLNRIISLNVDRGWRRRAVKQLNWEHAPEGTYLDLCAGTLDFGAMLAKQPGFRGRVVGADFVPLMLQLGRDKASGLEPVAADALGLPFPDRVFDGAMVGWGLRNLIDLDAALSEAARVMKPGAKITILDMATPSSEPFRSLYLFYFERVVPMIGRLISKHATAYSWLPQSTRSFPRPEELARRLSEHGFRDVTYRLLAGGVAALHVGTRAD